MYIDAGQDPQSGDMIRTRKELCLSGRAGGDTTEPLIQRMLLVVEGKQHQPVT